MNKPSGRAFYAVIIAYAIVAGGFWLHGAITERGLVGWLLDMQLQLTGRGSLKMAAFLGLVVLAVPGFALAFAWIKLGFDFPDLAPAVPEAAQADKSLRQVKLVCVIMIGLGPIVAALGGVFLVYGERLFDAGSYRHARFEVAATAEPPRFVEVEAVLLSDLVYQWKEGTRTLQVTPIVPKTWRPDQPIRYFIRGSSHEPTRRPYLATVRGEIHRSSLPTFVTSAYQREKFGVADAHFVIVPGEANLSGEVNLYG